MDDYREIRLGTLRGDQKITFDAYVKVAGKQILYCREGDSFEGERLDRLIQKKMNKMYVRGDQYHLYDHYLKENMLRAFANSHDMELEQRTRIVQGLMMAASDSLTEEPESPDQHAIAKGASEKFLRFIDEEPEALYWLYQWPNKDHSVSQHSANVAGLSYALAKEVGLAQARPMEMAVLCLGSLVHDIEHKYTPVNRGVPAGELPKNEYKVYRQHSQLGADRLKGHDHIPPLMHLLTLQHDERIDGSGPLKLNEDEIDPLVFVLAAADAFDKTIHQKKLPPKEALKQILIDYMGTLPLDFLKALQETLKKAKLVGA